MTAICPKCSASSILADEPVAHDPHWECPACKSSVAWPGRRAVESIAPTRLPGDLSIVDESAADDEQALPDVPGYDVLELIGQGGMGVVLKARHRTLGRLTAIKLPLPSAFTQPGWRQRFLREAHSAAKLSHPNVCPIYEIGDIGRRPFIAMRFIDGEPLSRYAKENALTPRDAATLLLPIAHAAGHAHHHGVIHRDIKPGNILIDRETKQPILTDFGLAREQTGNPADDATQLTQSGQVVGTPAYMAPEQASGESDKIGPHSDVYALGAVLYDLLCQQPPFTGSTWEIIAKLSADDPRPLRSLNKKIPRDLETICLKCLTRQPEKRYRSAGAFADDLSRFLAGEPIEAKPVGALVWATRKLARRKLVTALVGLIALATIISALIVRQTHMRGQLTEQLATQLEQLTESSSFSTADEARLSGLAARLHAIAPERAATLALRRTVRIETTIRAKLARPDLSATDLIEVDRLIAYISNENAMKSTELRQLRSQRQRDWQLVMSLQPPFSNLDSVMEQADRLLIPTDDRAAVLVPIHGDPTPPFASILEGDARLVATIEPSPQGSRTEVIFGFANELNQEPYRFCLSLADYDARTGGHQAYENEQARPGIIAVSIKDPSGTFLACRQVANPNPYRMPLHVSIERLGSDVFRVQVEGIVTLQARDLFPKPMQRIHVSLLESKTPILIRDLSLFQKLLPPAPSPLEDADRLLAAGNPASAARVYQQQADDAADADLSEQARYKLGVCLLKLDRAQEALAAWTTLSQHSASLWATLASAQIWQRHHQRGETPDAEAVLNQLLATHSFEELADQLPLETRRQMLEAYAGIDDRFNVLKRPTPEQIVRIEKRLQVIEAWSEDDLTAILARWQVLQLYLNCENWNQSEVMALQMMHGDDLVMAPWLIPGVVDALSHVMRKREASTVLEAECLKLRTKLSHAGTPGGERIELAMARVELALGKIDDAGDQIEALWKFIATHRWDYATWCDVALLRGYIKQLQESPAAAEAAWREGTLDAWRKSPENRYNQAVAGSEVELFNETQLINTLILDSLVGGFTSDDLSRALKALVAKRTGNPVWDAVGKMMFLFDLNLFREMWTSPRGKIIATEYVLGRDFPRASRAATARAMVDLLLNHRLAMDCEVPGDAKLAVDFEKVREAAITRFLDDYAEGHLAQRDFVTGMLLWQGINARASWTKFLDAMSDSTRPSASIVVAMRYRKLNRPDEARLMLQFAIDHAPPTSDAAVLAQAMLGDLTPATQQGHAPAP